MRRRLDLAASLVGRPSVIFLDEPTTGLDPAKREDMWDVVRRLVADGSTVLLTTQYLDEADALADEITVIDHGRVIAHDTPDGLKRVVGGQRIAVRPTDPTGWTTSRAILRRDRRRRARADRPRRAHRAGRRRGRALPRAVGRLAAERHRRHRALPAPAEPGRGLPDPDRPRTDDDTDDTDNGGGGMTTDHRPSPRPAPARSPVAAPAAGRPAAGSRRLPPARRRRSPSAA